MQQTVLNAVYQRETIEFDIYFTNEDSKELFFYYDFYIEVVFFKFVDIKELGIQVLGEHKD